MRVEKYLNWYWILTIFFLWVPVLCHTEFEDHVTPEKVVLMLVSHFIILPGVYFFYRIGKYDFALVGFLSFATSIFYHISQEGWLNRVSLLIPHIGDFTLICVGFLIGFLSVLSVEHEIRLYVVLIFFTFPFMLGALTYDSYAMIAVLVASFFTILYFQHLQCVKQHGKWKFDKFNILCLLVLIGFAGAGGFFIYWGGNPGDDQYWWRHSIWHFFAFGAYDIAAFMYLREYLFVVNEMNEKEKKIIYVDRTGKQINFESLQENLSTHSKKKHKSKKEKKKEKKSKKHFKKESSEEQSEEHPQEQPSNSGKGWGIFQYLQIRPSIKNDVESQFQQSPVYDDDEDESDGSEIDKSE